MATGPTPDQFEDASVKQGQLEVTGAPGEIGRRGVLIKGALASAGLVAGTFVPPRITALDLHASRAAAASGGGNNNQNGNNNNQHGQH
ncbi:MAG TPA: hypothetical protein VIJ28_20395 [Chloroflexota bacterium]